MIYIGLNPNEITDYDTAKELGSWPRREISANEVQRLLAREHISCCHTEHKFILDLVKRRLGIEIKIPTPPLKHRLRKSDKVIIIFVCNIVHPPPAEGYSLEDMRKARIKFLLYTIS